MPLSRSPISLAGLLTVAVAAVAPPVGAQPGLRPVYGPTRTPRTALSAMVTYQWGGSFDTPRGRLSLAPSENYAGALNFRVRSGATAELYYSYQPTTLRLDRGAVLEPVAPTTVHYFQVGGRYEPLTGSRLIPFLVGTAGATLFDAHRNAQGIDYGSEWAFAFRFGLGGTAWLTSSIGLRGEVGLLLPIWWGGGGFLCGGGGCYTTIAGTALAQGTAGGGLSIGF